MVNFSKDGQGYFEFIEEICSDDFIKRVRFGLDKEIFDDNEIFDLFNHGNTTIVYISHKSDTMHWISVLTEIKSRVDESAMINEEFLSVDNLDVIFKYLAGDKNA